MIEAEFLSGFRIPDPAGNTIQTAGVQGPSAVRVFGDQQRASVCQKPVGRSSVECLQRQARAPELAPMPALSASRLGRGS